MTIAAVAVVIGVALVCTRLAWHVRARIDAAEMNMLANTISQLADERQAAINDAAKWHKKALEGPRWQEQARLAHKLEQYEHLLHCNGIKVDV